MIFYIFNNYFPDNGGFSKRCMKEIEIISEKHDIVVLCRGKQRNMTSSEFKSQSNKIKVHYFYPCFNINKKIVNYNKNIPVVYELIRNIGLMLSLAYNLAQLFWKYRGSKFIKIYAVVSPLTVPLISLIIGKLFGARPYIIEFHDLEPELAIHIKQLNSNSFVLRMEYLLEKLTCKAYKSIIVTSNTQANKIIGRTGVNRNKIHIIPNTIQVSNSIAKGNIESNLKGINLYSKFVVGYISSFSYTYQVNGLIKLISLINRNRGRVKKILLLIVGDGELLPKIKKLANKLDLNKHIIFTGKMKNINEIINILDAAMIPWEKDTLTETILPTKLFEYMQAQKSIIAPNFGEFKNILSNRTDSLLYNSIDDLLEYIVELQGNENLRSKLETNIYNKYLNYYLPNKYNNKIQKIVNL